MGSFRTCVILLIIVYFAVVSKCNPIITPFQVVNLHENTQVETEVSVVTCSDTTNAGVGLGRCPVCNIIREVPANAPFRTWKKTANSEFRVYYVAGQTNSQLSYRNVAKSYFLDIQCDSTDGNTDVETLEIDILPNQAPFITDFPGVTMTRDARTTLPDTVLYTMTVTDPESDPLTYTLYTEPVVDYFKLGSAGGDILTAKDLRTAVEPVVAIKVNVSDGYNTVGPFTLRVTITDLNTRPRFSNLPTNITLYETVGSGQLLITLTIVDPDTAVTLVPSYTVNPATDRYKFVYEDGTRRLRLATAAAGENILDAETTSYYNISFLLNDGFLDSVGQYINLYVLNVNEPPVFNEPIYFCQMYESQTFEYSCDLGLRVTDPDGDVITHTFLIEANNSERFRYDDARKIFSYNIPYDIDQDSFLPTAAVFTIAAEDPQKATGTAKIQVTILDINDNAPSFIDSDNAFSIDQNTNLGRLGYVTAKDKDRTSPNNQVTYTQVGGTGGLSQHLTVLGDGEVRYTNAFGNNQDGSSYFALVEAKDGGVPPKSSTGTVVISFVTTTTVTTTTVTTTTTSTTTASTTTTRAPGYFDEAGNVALFTVALILLLIALIAGIYLLYRLWISGRCCPPPKGKSGRVSPDDGKRRNRERDDINDYDDYIYDRPASTSFVRIGGVNNLRALPSPKPVLR